MNPDSVKGSFSKHSFFLNLSILLISTAGIFGRYIALPIPITIGTRAILACLVLYIFCRWKGYDFRIQAKDRSTIIWSGILFGVHWLTYFYALRLSNVAVGMLSLFTFPVLTAILEPLYFKTKILPFHIVLCVLILFGIYLLVPEFSLANDYFIAVLLGVFSALCYALRNISMKAKVKKYNGSVLMMYQLLIVSILLIPSFFIIEDCDILEYWPALLTLAMVTTAIGHTLFLYSFTFFSTTSASIISCLQPIYGILMGVFFLHEYPRWQTLVGGSVILASVIFESYRVYRNNKLCTDL